LLLLSLIGKISNSFSQSRDLDFYLAAGIQNSPLLKDYSGELQRAELDSLLILAGRKIVITAAGQVLIAPVII
jgi:hypothetical protein